MSGRARAWLVASAVSAAAAVAASAQYPARPAVRLAKGARVRYRYREVADVRSDIRPGDGMKQHARADTTWDVELEGGEPRADGSADVSVQWTRLVGATKFVFGENTIDTDAAKPVTGSAPQPSNTREARLVRLTKQASTVTVSPRGDVAAVQGAARVLLEFVEGPGGMQRQTGALAEADLAATFQRWFPALPDQRPRPGTTWVADRVVAPEVVTVIDLQTYGVVPEKLTAKSVRGDVVAAAVAAEKRAPRKRPDEDRKDPPSVPEGDVRPSGLGVGEAWSWKLTGECEIDLATGLYVTRRTKLEFTAGEWKNGRAYAAQGTVEVTLERVPDPPPGGK